MNALDDTGVELAIDQDDDLDVEDRSRLDEALHASKAELARGEVVPFDQVLGEI